MIEHSLGLLGKHVFLPHNKCQIWWLAELYAECLSEPAMYQIQQINDYGKSMGKKTAMVKTS